jgi:DNA-binding response OmpR family regulator
MRVLVVNQDANLANQLFQLLKTEGHELLTTPKTGNLLELVSSIQAHLVVYELPLLRIHQGLEQCRQLRLQSEVLLLIISDASELEDKLKAFAAGADDYLAKPFDIRELNARVLALLRRHPRVFSNLIPNIVPITSGIKLDLRRQLLISNGQKKCLRPLEFKLLSYFVQNPNIVLSREKLLEAVWGYDYASDTRQVDVYVCYLRQKIEPNPSEPRYIQTKWSVGYVFSPPIIMNSGPFKLDGEQSPSKQTGYGKTNQKEYI